MKKLIAALLLLLALTGCAAKVEAPGTAETPPAPETPPAAETPTVTKAPSPVYTDWSKLTPYEPVREIYSYHAGYRADGEFEPRDDYGVLLPYIGSCAAMEDYVIEALSLHGLVTSKGELVSEPVYAWINFYGDFMILGRADPEGDTVADAYGSGPYFRTLAAADGHWAHELGDSYYVAETSGALMTASLDGSLDLWNTEGEIVTHFDGARFRQWLGEEFYWEENGGPFISLADDKVGYAGSYVVDGEYIEDGVWFYLDLVGGEIMTEPPEGYPVEFDYSALEGDLPKEPEIEGCNYLDYITDPIEGVTYFLGFLPGEDGDGDWVYTLFDADGNVLVEDAGMSPFEEITIVRAGLCSTIEDSFFCFRSLHDGTVVFRKMMNTNTD